MMLERACATWPASRMNHGPHKAAPCALFLRTEDPAGRSHRDSCSKSHLQNKSTLGGWLRRRPSDAQVKEIENDEMRELGVN